MPPCYLNLDNVKDLFIGMICREIYQDIEKEEIRPQIKLCFRKALTLTLRPNLSGSNKICTKVLKGITFITNEEE